jgi:transposase
MNNVSVARPYRKRRQYTPEFKTQLVAESQIPGASISRVALDNDLNTNLLRRWVSKCIKQVKACRQPPPLGGITGRLH